MKRFLALVLAIMMLFGITACSTEKKDDKGENPVTEPSNGMRETSEFVFANPESTYTMPEFAEILDVQKIYENLEYTADMLYGNYVLEDYVVDGFIEKHAEKYGFTEFVYKERYQSEPSQMITTMPYCLYFNSDWATYNFLPEYDWIKFSYVNEDMSTTDVSGIYVVNGNTLTIVPVEVYEDVRDYDTYTAVASFSFMPQRLEYTFSFDGCNLTLSDGTNECTYPSVDMSGDFYLSATCDNENDAVDGIYEWLLYTSPDDGSFFCEDAEGNLISDGIATLSKDGLFRYAFTDDEGVEHSGQYALITGNSNLMMILTDGVNTYRYMKEYNDNLWRFTYDCMYDGLENIADLYGIEVDEEVIEQEEEIKKSLIDELVIALDEAGIDYKLDKVTGEITLSAAVLFAKDEFAVTEDGGAFLKNFITAYASVLADERFASVVSRIFVEGHTDTDGTYDYNLELSQKRAQSVLDFCISDTVGLDAATVSMLQSKMVPLGYSWDYPIYDEAGNVDMDASRRVSFRFMIQIDME